MPGTRVCDQKIQRLLADFEAHQRFIAAVLALAGKTVFAGKITVVGDMQTESLDDRGTILEIPGQIFHRYPQRTAAHPS